MEELFSSDVLVLNLITALETAFATLDLLTPLPNDSTTQKRDALVKMGIEDHEIQVYMKRLNREIDMIVLVLLRIGEKVGLSYEILT
jgi:hypothetical protein